MVILCPASNRQALREKEWLKNLWKISCQVFLDANMEEEDQLLTQYKYLFDG